MEVGLGPPWERAGDRHPSSPSPEGQSALWAASPPTALPLTPRGAAVPGEWWWVQLEDGYGKGKVQISRYNLAASG